jgi:hypothetical protein
MRVAVFAASAAFWASTVCATAVEMVSEGGSPPQAETTSDILTINMIRISFLDRSILVPFASAAA